jgi:hypothetical protein
MFQKRVTLLLLAGLVALAAVSTGCSSSSPSPRRSSYTPAPTPRPTPPPSRSSDSPFQSQYVAGLQKPEVVVKNNTDLTLKLSLSGPTSRSMILLPGQTKTATLDAGSYSYNASADGVTPCIGSESFQKHYRYSWTFFVRTVTVPAN